MKRLKILRRWFARKFGLARLVCLGLLVVFASLRVWDPPPVQELRLRVFDIFQLLDPRDKKEVRPVTIIDIDDKSLARFGQWPWPRTRIADMIINLTNLGAVAIGFDVVFSEADRLNPDLVANQMRYLDEVTRTRLRELPSNDQILSEAIKRSRVVLGETGQPEVGGELDKTLPFTGVATVGEADADKFLFEFPGLLRNVPVIEKVAAGRGLFSIKTERDGLIRRVPMIMRAQGNIMPSLSLEILRVITGTPTLLLRTEKTGIRAIRLKGFEIPTDKNGQLWIHYARRDPTIYVSAADVLDNTVPPSMIRGKLVLIGTSAAGLNDIKTTPVSSTMPGVEIHAQVLESVLS
ncbi:CHASE2 domain-containing protein, partial [Bradyrhizobium campsiandrae]